MGEIDRDQHLGAVRRHGRLVYGADAVIGPWVARRIPDYHYAGAPTIGVIRDARIVAGVVYENWNGVHCTASLAAEPRSGWASRRVLFGLFAYPFLQLECEAITALVAASNLRALKADLAMGFKPEAVIRFAAHDGGDLIALKMFRHECRWITRDGQGRRQRAEAAGSGKDGGSGSEVQPG